MQYISYKSGAMYIEFTLDRLGVNIYYATHCKRRNYRARSRSRRYTIRLFAIIARVCAH